MRKVRYLGHGTLTYMDYMNCESGKTLVAVPGHIYEVAVASGRSPSLPEVPMDGRWAEYVPKPTYTEETPLDSKETKVSIGPIRRGVAKKLTLTPEVKE